MIYLKHGLQVSDFLHAFNLFFVDSWVVGHAALAADLTSASKTLIMAPKIVSGRLR